MSDNVATMVTTGAIKDTSFLWWTLRPSMRYPTLELRVADSCTNLDDAVAIAVLYRCLVRRAVREPQLNLGMTGASRAIVSENLWRAQRDGVRASFIGIETARPVSCADYLAVLLRELASDVIELDCATEVGRTKDIVAHGTSADHQLAISAQSQRGVSGLESVVDWIADVTATR